MATANVEILISQHGQAVLMRDGFAYSPVFESVAEADEFVEFAGQVFGPTWEHQSRLALTSALTSMRAVPRIPCGGCGRIHRAYGQFGLCPTCSPE